MQMCMKNQILNMIRDSIDRHYILCNNVMLAIKFLLLVILNYSFSKQIQVHILCMIIYIYKAIICKSFVFLEEIYYQNFLIFTFNIFYLPSTFIYLLIFIYFLIFIRNIF